MDDYQAIINSPIGKLGICTNAVALTGIHFLNNSVPLLKAQSSLAQQISNELHAYFDSARFVFTLNLALEVTPFQRSVLNALQQIPSGNTRTYGQLAQQLNSGPRAVGMACRHNPIPLVIPCHRIVAAKHLGGYSGATQGNMMKIKEWLLQHES